MRVASSVLAVLLFACGGSEPAPAGPGAATGSAAAPPPASSAPAGASAPPAVSAAPAASAKPAAPAYQPKTPEETLALALLDRRESIGWSAKKKLIAYSTTVHVEGTGYSLHVGFMDPKTQKDAEGWDACDPCDKLADELAKKVPELAKKLEGYAEVKGVEVPAGKAVDVPGSQLTAVFEGGKVLLGPAGAKPTKIAATLKATAPHKPTLERLWFVADGKLVIGRVRMDPGSQYGTYNVFEQVRVFPVP